jgi:hypothetical protein|uniref:Uncharacterized protein n=1 Tax=Mus musculus TaxID=10090 RepID=Q8CAQ3_MOUSE|nr:unnamed protein product [Mus musculus]
MRSDGRVGRRRWQARSAGAQRPLSLSAAACRAGLPALRGGMAGLGELLAPSAAQSPPTTLAEYSSGAALGAVRGQPWAPPPTEPWWWPWEERTDASLHADWRETARALRLKACFLGAPRQPGEALKSPAWAEEYPEIPWTVLGVFIFLTTRWEGLAWPSRPPIHRPGPGRLNFQAETNQHP